MFISVTKCLADALAAICLHSAKASQIVCSFLVVIVVFVVPPTCRTVPGERIENTIPHSHHFRFPLV